MKATSSESSQSGLAKKGGKSKNEAPKREDRDRKARSMKSVKTSRQWFKQCPIKKKKTKKNHCGGRVLNKKDEANRTEPEKVPYEDE